MDLPLPILPPSTCSIQISNSKSNNQELTVFEIQLTLVTDKLFTGKNLIEQLSNLNLPLISEFEE